MFSGLKYPSHFRFPYFIHRTLHSGGLQHKRYDKLPHRLKQWLWEIFLYTQKIKAVLLWKQKTDICLVKDFKHLKAHRTFCLADESPMQVWWNGQNRNMFFNASFKITGHILDCASHQVYSSIITRSLPFPDVSCFFLGYHTCISFSRLRASWSSSLLWESCLCAWWWSRDRSFILLKTKCWGLLPTIHGSGPHQVWKLTCPFYFLWCWGKGYYYYY